MALKRGKLSSGSKVNLVRTSRRKVSGIKILVLKSDIMPLIRRAKASHNDACYNSCHVPEHYPDCTREKMDIDRALKAISCQESSRD